MCHREVQAIFRRDKVIETHAILPEVDLDPVHFTTELLVRRIVVGHRRAEVIAKVTDSVRLGLRYPRVYCQSMQAARKERVVCSGRPKRLRNTLLPLLEYAIAYLHEFRVRFHVGAQFL